MKYKSGKSKLCLVIILVYIVLACILLFSLSKQYITPLYYFFMISILQMILLIVIKSNNNMQIGMMIVYLYLLTLFSIYATRFGLYPGDSQFDLFITQTIVRSHHIPQVFGYSPAYSPAIHMLTVFLGVAVGKFTPNSIYSVAVIVPVIISAVSIFIMFIFCFKFLKYLEVYDRYYLFLSVLLVFSNPLLIRWLIQYTRTTMSIVFFILLLYLIVFSKRSFPRLFILLIFLISLMISHPMTAIIVGILFGVLGTSEILMKKSTKYFDIFLLFSALSLSYWFYIGGLQYILVHTIKEIFASIVYRQPLVEYIISKYIIPTGKFNLAYSSNEQPLLIKMLKYCGLLRNIVVFGIILVGILEYFKKYINKNKLEIHHFGLIIITATLICISAYLLGPASITYLRVVIYLLLVSPIPVYLALLKVRESRRKVFKYSILIIVYATIFSAPYFYDQSTNISQWIYSRNPHDNLDTCQIQRYLDYYHLHVPKWINIYTDKDALFWTADAIHLYSSILGFGNRYAIYEKTPIANGVLDVEYLYKNHINFIVITDLDKKCIIFPYAGVIMNPDFKPIYLSQKPIGIIYSSNHIVIGFITDKIVKNRKIALKGFLEEDYT